MGDSLEFSERYRRRPVEPVSGVDAELYQLSECRYLTSVRTPEENVAIAFSNLRAAWYLCALRLRANDPAYVGSTLACTRDFLDRMEILLKTFTHGGPNQKLRMAQGLYWSVVPVHNLLRDCRSRHDRQLLMHMLEWKPAIIEPLAGPLLALPASRRSVL